MSTDRTDQRPKLWAFQRDGSVVGVVADSEEAAARALRDGSVPPIRLKSTPPIALESPGGGLVALGVINDTTPLLDGYRTHDQSVITLEDPSGSRWALRPNPHPAEDPMARP